MEVVRPLGQRTVIDGDGWSLSVILTPGHTANHAVLPLRAKTLYFPPIT